MVKIQKEASLRVIVKASVAGLLFFTSLLLGAWVAGELYGTTCVLRSVTGSLCKYERSGQWSMPIHVKVDNNVTAVVDCGLVSRCSIPACSFDLVVGEEYSCRSVDNVTRMGKRLDIHVDTLAALVACVGLSLFLLLLTIYYIANIPCLQSYASS
jgi:hypothetical protein